MGRSIYFWGQHGAGISWREDRPVNAPIRDRVTEQSGHNGGAVRRCFVQSKRHGACSGRDFLGRGQKLPRGGVSFGLAGKARLNEKLVEPGRYNLGSTVRMVLA